MQLYAPLDPTRPTRQLEIRHECHHAYDAGKLRAESGTWSKTKKVKVFFEAFELWIFRSGVPAYLELI